MKRSRAAAAFLLVVAGCARTSPEERAYVEELMRDRSEKDRVMQSADGPLPEAVRPRFKGLAYYPPRFDLVFDATLEPAARADTVQFVTSQNTFDAYRRRGVFRFRFDGREQSLTLFEALDGGHLFLPFTDVTSGDETYGAGRYLDPIARSGNVYHLDFNRAYNPYCAYGPGWICPVAPEENRLDFAVRAGERLFPLAEH